jgi:carboxypeptidase family protein/TonB-dependent receptor-like protein
VGARQESMFARVSCIAAMMVLASVVLAATFGRASGVVEDSQQRVIAGATVLLQSKSSDWAQSAHTDAAGRFAFGGVPPGEYKVTASAPGFAGASRDLTVTSAAEAVVQLTLPPAAASETVTVTEAGPALRELTTSITTVDRAQIAQTPGASRPNSMAAITDYVPGAYITHSQLHIRGGHQTEWLIDGVPVPSTNIDTNLAPQFSPADMDYLEIHRGGYGAEVGDRAYGVFNVVPRTGFERKNEAELVLNAGNFYQTNDQLSFGSHSGRLAYYGSISGNRSDLGIQTPVPQVVHDETHGYGGFGSLIFNRDSANQLRVVGAARHDFYQIPYDPFPNDFENTVFPSIGLRDTDRENDVLLNTSWVHTFNSHWLLTLSPIYHYNFAGYESSPTDTPVAVTQERSSHYAGGQWIIDGNVSRHHLQAGMYGFYEQDSELFAALFNNGGGSSFREGPARPSGRLASFFIDEKFKPFSWLTLMAGARPAFYDGGVTESTANPRFGVAVTLPRLQWTLRGFWGHYYQAPPLITASGPLLQFISAQDLTFAALHGERDEEYQFGITMPWRGWTLDVDSFRNRVVNFFDHSNIGLSNLSFPVTIQSGLVRAWELTLRSPRIQRRVQLHLAYSNQIAEAGGVITGGLKSSEIICDEGPTVLCPVDHDQRNTLSVGGDVVLPWHAHAATNVTYGSGFTNGQPGVQFPGNYLPAHTTVDLSLGKDLGKRYSASVTVLNVANRRVLIDNSVAFGGFHWNAPREIYGQLRYRFHY